MRKSSQRQISSALRFKINLKLQQVVRMTLLSLSILHLHHFHDIGIEYVTLRRQ